VYAALDRYGRALVDGDLGDRALEVALAHGRVPLDDDELLERVQDASHEPEGRAASLRALAARGPSEGFEAALAEARGSDEPLLRAEARDALAALRPAEALAALREARFAGELIERQRAFAALGKLRDPGADALLAEAFDRLEAGTLDAGVQLDLLEAARARGTQPLVERIAALEARTATAGLFASRAWALEGGDAARGLLVFQGQGDCQRCHGDDAGHGAGAGPALDGISGRRDRAHFLRSVLEPSADIAEGFATLSVTLRDGSVVTGTLVSEENGELVLDTGGQERRVASAEIAERVGPVSAMPPNGLALPPRELRDLVAYLATL
jgi:putative heme-binding domain-containing protein